MPTPYLFFDGRCEEAIEFYKKALGNDPVSYTHLTLPTTPYV